MLAVMGFRNQLMTIRTKIINYFNPILFGLAPNCRLFEQIITITIQYNNYNIRIALIMNMFEVFEEKEFMEDFDILEDFRPQDRLRRLNERFDPFDLTENEFYTRFRFSKESVEDHLVPLLYPDGVRAENNRGHPFEP